jgi:hypothetical protein
MTKANKKFKFIWVRGAIQMMHQAGITFGLTVFSVLAVGSLFITPWAWAGIGLLAAFAVVTLYLFIGTAREAEASNHSLFVQNWIASAGNDSERQSRQSLLDNGGMDAALSAAGASAMGTAGVSWAFNVDGTPMVEGTGMDINGNPFGATHQETGLFNTDTGGFVSPSTSYNEPFKMD